MLSEDFALWRGRLARYGIFSLAEECTDRFENAVRRVTPATLWQDAEVRRRVQRIYLKEFLQLHPSIVRRNLQKEHPKLYDWFMTWDRSWFDHCLPPRSPYTSPQRRKLTMSGTLAAATTVNAVADLVTTLPVDFQTPSDAMLAQRVRSTALQMVEGGSLLRICWATMRKRISELSISRGQLRKLPLTYAAVRDITENGEEASVRRIFVLARQWRAQGQRITKAKLINASSAENYHNKKRSSPLILNALQRIFEGQFE